MRKPDLPIDPTGCFKQLSADLAAAFRGIAKRDDVVDARQALDLIAAGDAIERALRHIKPGALARED